MKIKKYPELLQHFANQYLVKYMEKNSKDFLISRTYYLRESIERGERKNHEWSFSIPKENFLIFNENNNFYVDISGKIEGVKETIKKLNFNLRIWSCDENHCFREEWDAPALKSKIESCGGKRVILRFHFDLKDLSGETLEPLYHLHFGGKQGEGEQCWFHENISIPRFPYYPMDLILLCEFILMNFFPNEYKKIKENPEWKSAIRKSQEIFQVPYFKKCIDYISNEDDTLLGNLITSKGVAHDSE